jgi:hypothetical protein
MSLPVEDPDAESPEGQEPLPWDWDEDAEPYRRRGARAWLTKAVAVVLIIGMLLAFPLGYVLDEQLRNQHVEAVLAIVEVTIAIVLIVVVRGSRRRL